MTTQNKLPLSNGYFRKSNTLNSNNRSINDPVPPLIQIPASKKQSPINSLKNSLVRSQYLYEQGEKYNQKHQTQSKSKKHNQNYYYEVHYENPSINGYLNNEIANKNYQDHMSGGFEKKPSKQLDWMLSAGKNKQPDLSLFPNIKISRFDKKPSKKQLNYQKQTNQRAITQQQKDGQVSQQLKQEPEPLNLYNQTIQIYNRLVGVERGYSELYWLYQKPSTQLLSLLMANKKRLHFFLKYLQDSIVKKRNQKYQQDMQILSCLLIKILTQKNQHKEYVKPQMYVSSDGIKIDFDPQHQSKLKEQKILELRQKIYQKNKEIQHVTAQYCIIAENYAQAIFNIGKMNIASNTGEGQEYPNQSEAAQMMMMSFRKSNQSNIGRGNIGRNSQE